MKVFCFNNFLVPLDLKGGAEDKNLMDGLRNVSVVCEQLF